MQSSLLTFCNQNSVITMYVSYSIVNKNMQRYCFYQERAITINRNKLFTVKCLFECTQCGISRNIIHFEVHFSIFVLMLIILIEHKGNTS